MIQVSNIKIIFAYAEGTSWMIAPSWYKVTNLINYNHECHIVLKLETHNNNLKTIIPTVT